MKRINRIICETAKELNLKITNIELLNLSIHLSYEILFMLRNKDCNLDLSIRKIVFNLLKSTKNEEKTCLFTSQLAKKINIFYINYLLRIIKEKTPSLKNILDKNFLKKCEQIVLPFPFCKHIRDEHKELKIVVNIFLYKFLTSE